MSQLNWRKSSKSAPEQSCVEVAWINGVPLVRDSKKADGGRIGVSRKAWGAFLAEVRQVADPS